MTPSRETYCQGCGALLPPPARASGRRRKWCSARCRKQQYSSPCVECGAPTNGGNGRGSAAPKRCATCSARREGERAAAQQRARWADHRRRIEELWAAGATIREIRQITGIRCFTPGAYRRRGYNLPYRHRGYGDRVAAMTPSETSDSVAIVDPDQYAEQCRVEGREILAEDVVAAGSPLIWAEDEIEREKVEIDGGPEALAAWARRTFDFGGWE